MIQQTSPFLSMVSLLNFSSSFLFVFLSSSPSFLFIHGVDSKESSGDIVVLVGGRRGRRCSNQGHWHAPLLSSHFIPIVFPLPCFPYLTSLRSHEHSTCFPPPPPHLGAPHLNHVALLLVEQCPEGPLLRHECEDRIVCAEFHEERSEERRGRCSRRHGG